MIHGSCLCGAIRFTVGGPLTAPRFCYCTNCTKFAGTSPASWATTNRSRLTVEPGSGPVTEYDSGKGLRTFCASCGSPVWFASIDQPGIVAIPLGALDDGEIPAPVMSIWIRSKPSWCTLDDDLPQHPTNP